MARKKPPRSRPHHYCDMVHEEVAAQTPIVPQRSEQCETGRTRILEARERVGQKAERELLNIQFPAER